VARRLSDLPASVLNALLSRATMPLYRLNLWARGGAATVERGPFVATEADYAALLRLNERLEAELVEARQLVKELSGARQRVALVEADFVPARVAAGRADPRQPDLTIDRGTYDGVRVDQAVVAGDDLVGRVVGANSASATVRLIGSVGGVLEVRLTAAAGPHDQAATTRALLRCGAESDAFAAEVGAAQDAPIQVGDLATLADPRWPRQALGFVVGSVTDVQVSPDNPLLQRLIVRPRRDLARLDSVLVVVLRGAEEAAAP
jgi:rod shape-determining protein MreC